MQDRFKFRVWKKAENKMVEGVTYLNPFLLDEDIAKEKAKNYILMQSTGLKDKNGNLIFEGDIVRITKEDWKKDIYSLVYLVCWDRTQWQLGLLKHQRKKAQNNRRYDRKIPFKDIVCFECYTPVKEFAECEVIGNYFENEELMNK